MFIKTSDRDVIKPFLDKLYAPPADSHKGMNGKVLIIGGSSLFHSASLWAAEIASHFVDMVHYSSTKENNAIFHELKTVFRNGIVVEQKDIDAYAEEDDAILLGPGMVRDGDEGAYTRQLTESLIKKFPHKKFVFDAGALQMMDPEWLKSFSQKPIITPHQLEFESLFKVSIKDRSIEEKEQIVKEHAQQYRCIILMKAVVDIISDGTESYVIEGGNPGLTKGGSGDILAGLTVSLFSKNDPIISAVVSSYIEKTAAEELAKTMGNNYNMADLIKKIPEIFITKIDRKVYN